MHYTAQNSSPPKQPCHVMRKVENGIKLNRTTSATRGHCLRASINGQPSLNEPFGSLSCTCAHLSEPFSTTRWVQAWLGVQ
eukprot:465984-Amphidinium_carterae.1